MKDVDELLKRVKELQSKDKIDLSSDEDLSIALMNLISIEEHLYFTSMKTGKQEYLEVLMTAREIRKKLLAQIVKNPKGEEWCISKHLLAASMRLIEVGTKKLAGGKTEEANILFQQAFSLYSLFWFINIKSGEGFKKEIKISDEKGFISKLNAVVKKILDCCKE